MRFIAVSFNSESETDTSYVNVDEIVRIEPFTDGSDIRSNIYLTIGGHIPDSRSPKELMNKIKGLTDF